MVEGQSAIASSKRCCRHIWLEPEEARPTSAVIEAIAAADIIVAGPGSLFTSILPNLLIREIATAVSEADCPVVFICNVMTQPGETRSFTAADHLEALVEHTQPGIVSAMLVNTAEPPAPVVEFYRSKGALPVVIDRARLDGFGINVIYDELASGGNYFRHDSGKLATAIMSLL